VLRVQLEGKSIHDVLELTITEAIEFFAQIGDERGAAISSGLKVLEEVGLGYLQLGQPLNTLSGGESQRLKLVRHLTEANNAKGSTSNAQRSNGKPLGNLFIFDEPTTGLHFDDVAILLRLFQRLVDRGHSIVVIEHNLEVIKSADWVVDLGPEAGDAGGEVVATGTPEQIAQAENSYTGKFLAHVLGSARGSRAVFGGPPKSTTRIYADDDHEFALRAAEEPLGQWPNVARQRHALPDPQKNGAIHIRRAREHN